MTDAELNELDRLCAAVTPGPPWGVDFDEHCLVIVAGESGNRAIVAEVPHLDDPSGFKESPAEIARADFIAAARTALLALVAEVRRLRAPAPADDMTVLESLIAEVRRLRAEIARRS